MSTTPVTIANHDSGPTCIHARGCVAATRKTKLDHGPVEVHDADLDLDAFLANPDEGAVTLHACLGRKAAR